MANFCGNFFHGTTIKIQYRLLLIPWLKRNSRIICFAEGRDYSSSAPVRYIPKKNAKSEVKGDRYLEEEHIGPGLSVARFELSNESSRRLLDVDSKSDESCLPSEENYESNMEVEGDLTAVTGGFSEEHDKAVEDNSNGCCGFPSGRSWLDVQNSAIELLASRAFTSTELEKKLQAKKFRNETIDAVITDFQRRGLINDCLYAETYARSRWSTSSWGPSRIKQALLKKGISVADADKAIKLVFENSESGEDQDSEIAMSKLSIDQLYVQASKQWRRSEGVSHETRKSRIVHWLQYRGFNWGVIKYVLKKLESGGPS